MLSVNNPQLLTNQADIVPKLPIHELVILTKWHNDRMKIEDFFEQTIVGKSYCLLPILQWNDYGLVA